jgi:TPR repeat protein
MKWLQRAARDGSGAAENDIGYAYEHGLGVSQSYTEAAHWYTEAAKHGLTQARRNLALLTPLMPAAAQSASHTRSESVGEGALPNAGHFPAP